MSTWTAPAFAKINLHLAVHERRPDGYHALTTVFQTIGLADTVTLEHHDGPLTVRCPGSDAPEDETNLVVRAARALAAELGREADAWRFTLVKQVPTQAGLGGGSADAMAAMRLLCEAWRITPEGALLARVGAGLGADVPFFALGGTALGRGRGDELTPLPPLPRLACAIVRPPFGVSTADAYGWVATSRASGHAPGAVLVPPARTEDWPAIFAACRNDFEPVVAARHPEVADAVAAFRRAGAVLAMMSGSGSAVYGLFTEPAAVSAAVAGFTGRSGWRTWLTSTT